MNIASARVDKGATAFVEPKSLAEFEKLLRSAPDGIRVRLRPEIAAQIVPDKPGAAADGWNHGNRGMRPLDVARYRRDMSDDRWAPWHPIAFGVFGERLQVGDGQHRLRAQAESNTVQDYEVRVFRDLDEFTQYVITVDTGRARTLADLLGITGIAPTHQHLVESVVNCMHRIAGSSAPSSRLSKQERLDFAKQYIMSLDYAVKLPRREFRPHLLACIALAHAKRRKSTEAIVADVVRATGLEKGTHAHEITKRKEEWNGATGLARDRAMGVFLRHLHDAATGAPVADRFVFASTAMRSALASFVGKDAAEAWIKRHAPRVG